MNHVTVDRLRLILAIMFAGLAVWQPSRDCTATEAEESRTPGANLNALIRIGAAVDEDGWTVFKRSDDTRVFYVSNSQGNDEHDGLVPERDKDRHY